MSAPRRLVALLPACMLAGPGSALAQKTTGEVRGTVSDPSGAVVPAATVTTTNRHTGYTAQRAVDDKGEFIFPLLQTGDYRLEVAADGFKKHVRELVVAGAGDHKCAGPARSGSDRGGGLGPDHDGPGQRVERRVTQRLTKDLLADFPNLNRYGFANASLLPAVSQVKSRPETIDASIAGNPTDRNSFFIDGAEATDPWRGWSPRTARSSTRSRRSS